MPNEKNSGDSSHQALTTFIFSDTFTTDFWKNQFFKIPYGNMVQNLNYFYENLLFKAKISSNLIGKKS